MEGMKGPPTGPEYLASEGESTKSEKTIPSAPSQPQPDTEAAPGIDSSSRREAEAGLGDSSQDALENEQTILVGSDHDSVYSDADLDSLTASLTSSIFAHTHENGRRYHAYRAGSYWGPNDDTALDGLDLDHHVFLLAMNGALHLAPIGDSPSAILDLGTGTGIWAIEMGDQYPSASVTGNDLSPTLPQYVPSNVQFEIDDFCDEWTYESESFDFIHARQILGCVDSYTSLYRKVLRCLRPGGWYEQVEIDVTNTSEDGTHAGTALDTMGPYIVEAGERMGKPLRYLHKTKQTMIDAGFIDVTEVTYKLPIGAWPKDEKQKHIGICNVASYNAGIEGWFMRPFTSHLGWTAEEVQVFCAHVRRDLKDRRIHAIEEM